ncbi:MAG: hypothetical protein EOP19_02610 [Hyphomicrobiales bacterium]|nr:MAG: hypothetical protein EOP19_02610 [Hyphomicrobiales bacterium]
MKLNPKVTGALAWTGLVVVLAVPAADMLIGKPDVKANLTATTDNVQTSAVTPAARPAIKAVVPPVETAAAGADPVADFVKSGKKLPSYISGSDAPATETASVPAAPVRKPGTVTINPDGTIEKPAVTVPSVTTPAAPEVATVNPNTIAPVPLPASARPRPQTVTTLPAPTEAPLIIDENQVAGTGPVPPADIAPDDQFVTGDQLDQWDSGSLADYLARKGLMSDASGAAPSTSTYDADGFFLNDGPNRGRGGSRVIFID